MQLFKSWMRYIGLCTSVLVFIFVPNICRSFLAHLNRPSTQGLTRRWNFVKFSWKVNVILRLNVGIFQRTLPNLPNERLQLLAKAWSWYKTCLLDAVSKIWCSNPKDTLWFEVLLSSEGGQILLKPGALTVNPHPHLECFCGSDAVSFEPVDQRSCGHYTMSRVRGRLWENKCSKGSNLAEIRRGRQVRSFCFDCEIESQQVLGLMSKL